MQLTNEIKSKIFGLYIGCECYHPFTDRIFPINGSVTSEVEGGENYQLILTPLSEITDEDAIELYLLVNPEAEDVNDKNRHIEYAWWGKQYANANMQAAPYLIVTDFLRSRGYALPYMGIDLFESGIAIPKTNKK